MFKLVEKEYKDLEAIMQPSKNVDVQVLSGTCTRTLHQIKASKKHGCLLTRPYSCFCTNCSKNDFDHCINRNMTGGNFKERHLISNYKNKQISGQQESSDDGECSEDDDDVEDGNMTNHASDVDNFITVEKQDLSLSDLQVNNIVIIPVKDFRNRVFNYPAQITELNNGDIHIDYLKPDFDKKEMLIKPTSESEKNWIVSIEEVIMKLPDQKEDRRGRYIFDRKIILN